MNKESYTLKQIQALGIWVHYAQKVEGIIQICRTAEWHIRCERNHYRRFKMNQNERVRYVSRVVDDLARLNEKYVLKKDDLIGLWQCELQSMSYFVNQDY